MVNGLGFMVLDFCFEIAVRDLGSKGSDLCSGFRAKRL